MKNILFAAFTCILFFSCSTAEPELPQELNSLRLNYSNIEMNIGDTVHLKIMTDPVENLEYVDPYFYDIDTEIINYDFDYYNRRFIIKAIGFGETTLHIGGGYYNGEVYYRYPNDEWRLNCKIAIGKNLKITFPENKLTASSATIECNESVLKNCSRIEVSVKSDGNNNYGSINNTFYIDKDEKYYKITNLHPNTKYKGTVRLYAKGDSYSSNYIESNISFKTSEIKAEMDMSFVEYDSYYDQLRLDVILDEETELQLLDKIGFEISSSEEFNYYDTEKTDTDIKNNKFSYRCSIYCSSNTPIHYIRPYVITVYGNTIYGQLYTFEPNE